MSFCPNCLLFRRYGLFLTLLALVSSLAFGADNVLNLPPTDPAIAHALREMRQGLDSSKDLTSDFMQSVCGQQLEAPAPADSALPPGIQALKDKQVTVLLIPGYLNTRQSRIVDLFAPQKKMLKKLGIPFKRFAYGEHPSLANARLLTEEIAAAPGPVVLITHSEGSALTLKTLLVDGHFNSPAAIDPGPAATAALKGLCQRFGQRYVGCEVPQTQADTAPISNKVIGWISLNGNFGSPLATLITETQNPGPIARRIQSFLSRRPTDSAVSLLQMTPAVIGAYLKDNSQRIQSLVSQVPVLSLATWFEKEPDGQAGILGARQSFSNFAMPHVTNSGFPASDSIVPTQNQIVPGSDYVIAGNVPHYLTVKNYNRTWFLPWTRGREIIPASESTTVLLDLLGQKIAGIRK